MTGGLMRGTGKTEEPEELDWKWIDVDFLDDCSLL